MSSQIKGLSQFIADVRAATTSDAERARILTEIASLRKKISQGKVGTDSSRAKDGYECRKLVSKLLFVYMLGYDVDFGCAEMVALVHMPRFAEKHIGYLALSLLHPSRLDLQDKVIDAVEVDLKSPHEYFTSLSLNYVSQVADIAALSDSFVDRVYQLMVSPTSSQSVIKKASLCLAAFFKREPARFSANEDFRPRLERTLAVFSNASLGVSLSLLAFLRAVARFDADLFPENAYRVCLEKLEAVFLENDPKSADYNYYDVPSPWLLVELCELLCSLHMDVNSLQTLKSDENVASELCEQILVFCMRDIEDGEYTPSSEAPLQHRNARTMVLVSACQLAEQLSLFERRRELNEDFLDLIKTQLETKSANHRYFALELLKYVPLMTNDDEVPNLVLSFMRDRDLGIRALALDVLYSSVTHQTVEHVTKELLGVLAASDLQTRPQMVTRLTGMADRFTHNEEWYIDTLTALLILGGATCGDDLWSKLVKFVISHKTVQAYAVSSMYTMLSGKDARTAKNSVPFVCAAAFVLGEFATLYNGDILDVVVVLQDTIDTVGDEAKPMFLTAYVKIAAAFPSVRQEIADILDLSIDSTHFETQQRAVEYRRLLLPEFADLLVQSCQKMNLGSPIASPLQGQNTPIHQAIMPAQTVPFSMQPMQQPIQSSQTGQSLNPLINHTGASTASATSFSSPSTPVTTSAHPVLAPQPFAQQQSSAPPLLSSNWEFGFKRMLVVDRAVIYQDALLQIGCIAQFNKERGYITLHLKNISSFHLNSISITITNPMPETVLQVKQTSAINTSLAAGESTSQSISCEALQPFALTPVCRISYFSGVLCECSFKLPIVLEKFMTSSIISADQFHQRWNQLGPDLEFKKTFQNKSVSRGTKSSIDDEELVNGLKYGIVHNAVMGSAICGAAILHTRGGMFGCLLLLEPDGKKENYTATVRATQNRLVSVVLVNNVAHAYQL